MKFEVTHRTPLQGGKEQKYCGPSALSALSGYTTECVGAWINHWRGKPFHYQNRGVEFGLMEWAGQKLGLRMKSVPIRRMTVNQLQKKLAGGGELSHLWGEMLLVCAHHHWLAIYQGGVVDSGACAGSKPIPLRQYKKKRAIVRMVYIVERTGKRLKKEPWPEGG